MDELYTLEYSDGYYIARDGVGVLDLDDPQDREFGEFVVNALNKATCPNCGKPMSLICLSSCGT